MSHEGHASWQLGTPLAAPIVGAAAVTRWEPFSGPIVCTPVGGRAGARKLLADVRCGDLGPVVAVRFGEPPGRQFVPQGDGQLARHPQRRPTCGSSWHAAIASSRRMYFCLCLVAARLTPDLHPPPQPERVNRVSHNLAGGDRVSADLAAAQRHDRRLAHRHDAEERHDHDDVTDECLGQTPCAASTWISTDPRYQQDRCRREERGSARGAGEERRR